MRNAPIATVHNEARREAETGAEVEWGESVFSSCPFLQPRHHREFVRPSVLIAYRSGGSLGVWCWRGKNADNADENSGIGIHSAQG